LEEQLAASRHEDDEACLREVLLMEDRERVVISGIRQGGGVALATAQLCSGQHLRHPEPGFPDHARREELEELYGDFTVAAAAVMAVVNVEEIFRGAGQRP
jgi:hypothetical protein